VSSRELSQTTVEQPRFEKARGAPTPGLVVLFSGNAPMLARILAGRGGVELGRGKVGDVRLDDTCMSRKHARVTLGDGFWTIEDLGSRNGTALQGARVGGTVRVPAANVYVLRTGDTLFLLVPDADPYAPMDLEAQVVMGHALSAAWEAALRAAPGRILHVTGESGTGKELVARAFHAHGPNQSGPFVAVNAAAIPTGVAERLLFGARRGAFSGAHGDADGYFQEAHRGTLFLDEIGELELDVQAKLLRTLETGEVFPVGAAKPVRVDVCLCSATHADLRDRVAQSRFREDLYFRLGRPAVALPPLRARQEEIPFLVRHALREVDPNLMPHVSLIETCLLRAWPGNVRELLAECREAGRSALASSREVVVAADLGLQAGTSFARAEGSKEPDDAPVAVAPAPMPSRERIEAALQRCEGRVASAARELGLKRNQLRRWLAKHAVDPRRFTP